MATFVFDDYSILKQFPLCPIKPELGAHLGGLKLSTACLRNEDL